MVTAEYLEQKITNAKAGQENLASLYSLAPQVIRWAQKISREQGSDSLESTYAWGKVEEFLAIISDRQVQQKNQTYLDNFCQEYPEAVKCRVYDV